MRLGLSLAAPNCENTYKRKARQKNVEAMHEAMHVILLIILLFVQMFLEFQK